MTFDLFWQCKLHKIRNIYVYECRILFVFLRINSLINLIVKYIWPNMFNKFLKSSLQISTKLIILQIPLIKQVKDQQTKFKDT